jgi:hypothetical protein
MAQSVSYWLRDSRPYSADGQGIDLRTIRLKVKHSCYRGMDELTRDVRDIWKLAQERYGDRNEVTQMALGLLRMYDDKVHRYQQHHSLS